MTKPVLWVFPENQICADAALDCHLGPLDRYERFETSGKGYEVLPLVREQMKANLESMTVTHEHSVLTEKMSVEGFLKDF